MPFASVKNINVCMFSDVDSFNHNFFLLKVSFIGYINLWAKFQNDRQSYLHPLESSIF